MESEGLAELLKQYSTLTRKLRDTEEELDKLHESAPIEGVYTFTFSNKQFGVAFMRRRLNQLALSSNSTKLLTAYRQRRKLANHEAALSGRV